jgi:hypothetical protein
VQSAICRGQLTSRYSGQRALCSVQRRSVHGVCSACLHGAMYRVQCSACIVQCAMFIVQRAVCRGQRLVVSVECAIGSACNGSVSYEVCNVQCAQCTSQFFSAFFALPIILRRA